MDKETRTTLSVALASQQNEARALGSKFAQEEKEKALAQAEIDLPKNKILRTLRRAGSALNPKNLWNRTHNTALGEKYRLVNKDKFYQDLLLLDRSSGAYEPPKAVKTALEQLKSSGESTIQRIDPSDKELKKERKPVSLTAGEELIKGSEIPDEFNTALIKEVLLPTAKNIRTLENKPINREDFIQKRLAAVVSELSKNKKTTEETRKFVEKYFGKGSNRYGESTQFFATNILAAAQRVADEEAIEEFTLEEFDKRFNLDTKVFRSNTDNETQSQYNAADRFLAWSNDKHLNVLVNPATVGIAASALTYIGIRKLTSSSKLGAAAAMGTVVGGAPVLPVLMAGVAAAAATRVVFTNYELKESLALAQQTFENEASAPQEGSKQHDLEKYLVHGGKINEILTGKDTVDTTKNSKDILGQDRDKSIDELIAELDSRPEETKEPLIRRYAEMKALRDFPAHTIDTKKFIFFKGRRSIGRGVIQYQGEGKAQGQLKLVEAMANIRIALEKNFGSLDTSGIEAKIADDASRFTQKLLSETQDKERAFTARRLGVSLNLFNRRDGEAPVIWGRAEAWQQAGVAAIIGGTLGVGWHELAQHASLGEPHPVSGGQGAKDLATPTPHTELTANFSPEHMQELYKNGGEMKLANGYTAKVTAGTHGVDIYDSGHKIVPVQVGIEPNGHLIVSQDSSFFLDGIKQALPGWQSKATDLHSLRAQILDARDLKNVHGGADQYDSNGFVIPTAPAEAPVGAAHAERIQQGSLDIRIWRNAGEEALQNHIAIFDTVTGRSTDGTIALDGRLDLQITTPTDAGPRFVGQVTDALNRNSFQVGNVTETSDTNTSVAAVISESIQNHSKDSYQIGPTDPDGSKVLLAIDATKDVPSVTIQDITITQTGGGFERDVDGTFQNGSLQFDSAKLQPDIIEHLQSRGFSLDGSTKDDGIFHAANIAAETPSLHSVGIVETSGVNEAWKFHGHVPTPRGNELTLHVGKNGVINSGADLTTGPIPSHINGAPAQVDESLKQIIDKNGPINNSDAAFIFLTNDNHQFAAGQDIHGNFQLPHEFYNDKGQMVGIKSIASVVITDKDGQLIKPTAVISSGKMPDGVTIHSLASQTFQTPTTPTSNLDAVLKDIGSKPTAQTPPIGTAPGTHSTPPGTTPGTTQPATAPGAATPAGTPETQPPTKPEVGSFTGTDSFTPPDSGVLTHHFTFTATPPGATELIPPAESGAALPGLTPDASTDLKSALIGTAVGLGAVGGAALLMGRNRFDIPGKAAQAAGSAARRGGSALGETLRSTVGLPFAAADAVRRGVRHSPGTPQTEQTSPIHQLGERVWDIGELVLKTAREDKDTLRAKALSPFTAKQGARDLSKALLTASPELTDEEVGKAAIKFYNFFTDYNPAHIYPGDPDLSPQLKREFNTFVMSKLEDIDPLGRVDHEPIRRCLASFIDSEHIAQDLHLKNNLDAIRSAASGFVENYLTLSHNPEMDYSAGDDFKRTISSELGGRQSDFLEPAMFFAQKELGNKFSPEQSTRLFKDLANLRFTDKNQLAAVLSTDPVNINPAAWNDLQRIAGDYYPENSEQVARILAHIALNAPSHGRLGEAFARYKTTTENVADNFSQTNYALLNLYRAVDEVAMVNQIVERDPSADRAMVQHALSSYLNADFNPLDNIDVTWKRKVAQEFYDFQKNNSSGVILTPEDPARTPEAEEKFNQGITDVFESNFIKPLDSKQQQLIRGAVNGFAQDQKMFTRIAQGGRSDAFENQTLFEVAYGLTRYAADLTGNEGSSLEATLPVPFPEPPQALSPETQKEAVESELKEIARKAPEALAQLVETWIEKPEDPNKYGLTSKEKAAVLLIALGPDITSRIIQAMPENEIDKITTELLNVDQQVGSLRDSIIQEAYVNLHLGEPNTAEPEPKKEPPRILTQSEIDALLSTLEEPDQKMNSVESVVPVMTYEALTAQEAAKVDFNILDYVEDGVSEEDQDALSDVVDFLKLSFSTYWGFTGEKIDQAFKLILSDQRLDQTDQRFRRSILEPDVPTIDYGGLAMGITEALESSDNPKYGSPEEQREITNLTNNLVHQLTALDSESHFDLSSSHMLGRTIGAYYAVAKDIPFKPMPATPQAPLPPGVTSEHVESLAGIQPQTLYTGDQRATVDYLRPGKLTSGALPDALRTRSTSPGISLDQRNAQIEEQNEAARRAQSELDRLPGETLESVVGTEARTQAIDQAIDTLRNDLTVTSLTSEQQKYIVENFSALLHSPAFSDVSPTPLEINELRHAVRFALSVKYLDYRPVLLETFQSVPSETIKPELLNDIGSVVAQEFPANHESITNFISNNLPDVWDKISTPLAPDRIPKIARLLVDLYKATELPPEDLGGIAAVPAGPASGGPTSSPAVPEGSENLENTAAGEVSQTDKDRREMQALVESIVPTQTKDSQILTQREINVLLREGHPEFIYAFADYELTQLKIGIGSRGGLLYGEFMRQENEELQRRYVADPDQTVASREAIYADWYRERQEILDKAKEDLDQNIDKLAEITRQLRALDPQKLRQEGERFVRQMESLNSSLPSATELSPVNPTVIPQPASPTQVPAPAQEMENLEATATKSLDYEQFTAEHPYVNTGDLQTRIIPPEEIEKEYGKFIIEETKILGEPISILTVPDKQEDAIGVRIRNDGVINMVVADGVTNSVLPRVASRIAVEASLNQLAYNSPSNSTLEAAWNGLQQLDLSTMATSWQEHWKEQGRRFQGPGMNIPEIVASKMEHLREEGATAATTLAIAQFDPTESVLKVAVRGDSRVVIFGADGNFRVISDNSPQIRYAPGTQYSPQSEIIESILLQRDDVVILSSDGLKESLLPEINEYIKQFRGISNRIDEIVSDKIRADLRGDAFDDDDLSVIVFQNTSHSPIETQDTVGAGATQAKEPNPQMENLEATAGIRLPEFESYERLKAYILGNPDLPLSQQNREKLFSAVEKFEGSVEQTLQGRPTQQLVLLMLDYINQNAANLKKLEEQHPGKEYGQGNLGQIKSVKLYATNDAIRRGGDLEQLNYWNAVIAFSHDHQDKGYEYFNELPQKELRALSGGLVELYKDIRDIRYLKPGEEGQGELEPTRPDQAPVPFPITLAETATSPAAEPVAAPKAETLESTIAPSPAPEIEKPFTLSNGVEIPVINNPAELHEFVDSLVRNNTLSRKDAKSLERTANEFAIGVSLHRGVNPSPAFSYKLAIQLLDYLNKNAADLASLRSPFTPEEMKNFNGGFDQIQLDMIVRDAQIGAGGVLKATDSSSYRQAVSEAANTLVRFLLTTDTFSQIKVSARENANDEQKERAQNRTFTNAISVIQDLGDLYPTLNQIHYLKHVVAEEPEHPPLILDPKKDLVSQLREKLSGSGFQTEQVEATLNELTDFARTIPLPKGAKMQSLSPKINGNRIQVHGTATAVLSNLDFNVTLANNPHTQMLQVVNHNVAKASGAFRLARGDIESSIDNLPKTVIETINKQLGSGWQTSNITFEDGKVVFSFQKTPPAQNT